MKITKKNLPTFLLITLTGLLIGSFAWEILERLVVVITGNKNFSLGMENPIQLFDVYVLALSFRANPGTLLGFITGIILYGRLK